MSEKDNIKAKLNNYDRGYFEGFEKEFGFDPRVYNPTPSLDKKLKEVVMRLGWYKEQCRACEGRGFFGGTSPTTPVQRCPHCNDPHSPVCRMTGQEWYDKFEKELPADHLLPQYVNIREQVLEAAKKAAGIE